MYFTPPRDTSIHISLWRVFSPQRGLSSIENEWLPEEECQKLCQKGWTKMVGVFMGIWNKSQRLSGTNRTVCDTKCWRFLLTFSVFRSQRSSKKAGKRRVVNGSNISSSSGRNGPFRSGRNSKIWRTPRGRPMQYSKNHHREGNKGRLRQKWSPLALVTRTTEGLSRGET